MISYFAEGIKDDRTEVKRIRELDLVKLISTWGIYFIILTTIITLLIIKKRMGKNCSRN